MSWLVAAIQTPIKYREFFFIFSILYFLTKIYSVEGVSIIEFEDQVYVKVKTVPHFANQLLCF